MKRIMQVSRLLFVFVVMIVVSSCHPQSRIVAEARADGLVYTIESRTSSTPTPAYGDTLVITRNDEPHGREQIYTKDFTDLKPWKIVLADVDGDGEKEILIAVHKTTHFDAEAKNRLFIFTFDGEKLYKKWTGSQIAGWWSDFYVGDLLPIRGEQLLFVERIDGGARLQLYYWFDFGFQLLATSATYDDIVDAVVQGENQLLLTYVTNGKKVTRNVMVQDSTFIERVVE